MERKNQRRLRHFMARGIFFVIMVSLILATPASAATFTFSGGVSINGVTHTVNITQTGPVQVALYSAGYAALSVSGPGGFNLPGMIVNVTTETTTQVFNATATGNYSFSLNGGTFSAIAYTLTIQENTGTPDLVPPDTQITSGPPDPSTSNTATLTFTGTDNVTSPVFLFYECRLDSGPYNSCAGTRTLTNLEPGAHTFYVRSTDKAGNTDPTPATYTWTVDNCIDENGSLTFSGNVGGAEQDSYLFCVKSSADVLVTASGTGQGTVVLPDADAPAYPPERQLNFNTTPASKTYLLFFANQNYTLNVTGANIDYNVTVQITLDTTPPETSFVSTPAAQVYGSSASFSFTASDNTTGTRGMKYRCSLNGAAFEYCNSTTTINALFNGSHTLAVAAEDRAGNVDPTPATYTWNFCMPTPSSVSTVSGFILAVESANCNPANDTFSLASGTTFTFTTAYQSTTRALPDIALTADGGTLTINGSGAIIERDPSAANFSLVQIFNGSQVQISNATIRNFSGGQGGAIRNSGILTLSGMTFNNNTAIIGGGLYALAGTLTVQNSTFTGNSAGEGGGLAAGGNLTITNTTFANNSAPGGAGGGMLLYSGSGIAIRRTTFSGNSATDGGALYADYFGLGGGVIENSTFYGNSATRNGGALYFQFNAQTPLYSNTITNNTASLQGGGIFSQAALDLRNTILAGNTAPTGTDFQGSVAIAYHNIIGSTTGITVTSTAVQGNIIDGAASPLNLGPLALNGGATQTVALGAGSVGIDTGTTTFVTPPSTDQRGTARVQGTNIDIGAFESAITGSPLISITTNTDTVPEGEEEVFSLLRSGLLTDAITVTLAISYGGTGSIDDISITGGNVVSLTSTEMIVTVPAGFLYTNVSFRATDDNVAEADESINLTLVDGTTYDLGTPNFYSIGIPRNDVGIITTADSGQGSLPQAIENANILSGAEEIVIPAGTYVLSAPLIIDDSLTMTGAGAGATILSGADSVQPMIINGGSILLRGFTITDGSAATGGGIGVYGGTVIIGNDPVNISGNNATTCGGGLYVGTGSVVNVQAGSQIVTNTTTADGGGICVENGTLTVSGPVTAVNDNTAGGNGGGIYIDGGSATLVNGVDVSLNSAGSGGGLYQVSGDVSVSGASIQENVATDGGGIAFSSSGMRTVSSSCIVLNSSTSILVSGGTGALATNNWWGSPLGAYSGLNTPAPNTIGNDTSTGDSVTPSTDPSFFDYSGHLVVAPSADCLVCEETSGNGAGRVCTVP